MKSIEDPQNTGALIRTALCADVDYIVMPKDRCALPSAGVSRSSAGAMEHAPIFLATNLSVLIRDLKKYGAWVSGLDAGGDKGLFEADLTGNLALVVGGEHTGLRPGIRKACDFILSIPMETHITSLNASVAGGIVPCLRPAANAWVSIPHDKETGQKRPWPGLAHWYFRINAWDAVNILKSPRITR